MAVILGAMLSACSARQPGVGPFGNDTSPGEQCIPLAGHAVASYGLEYVQNPTKTTATINSVTLRTPKGLQLVRTWAVPTTSQIFGVGTGYPPPAWPVIGWHWNQRQPAGGARVPHSTGKYDRMNLVLSVRLAPGRSRGRAAGVDVRYEVAGQHYYVPFRTALELIAGARCPN